MDASDKPLTVEASTPAPYVHLDNRALVLHDGRACVVYGTAAFPWLCETLRVLVEDGRATRSQGAQVFGGFVHADGRATLYAATQTGIVTCDVSGEAVRELHARLGRR